MDATSIRYLVTGTSTGTNGDIIWGDTCTSTSAGAFGIAPRIGKPYQFIPPQRGFRDRRKKDYDLQDLIPREHKDKNGCVKKSYWENEPFDVTDIGAGADLFGGIQDLGVGAFTISTSSGTCGTMGDTDADTFGTSNLLSADSCV